MTAPGTGGPAEDAQMRRALQQVAAEADEYADGWGLRNLTAADQFTALAEFARAALSAAAGSE